MFANFHSKSPINFSGYNNPEADRLLTVGRTSLDENLRIIEKSLAYLKAQGRYVVYDAEHFFDGWRADPVYALATLQAAVRAAPPAIASAVAGNGPAQLSLDFGAALSVDLRTGAEKWDTRKISKGCLILAEDHLIVVSEDGTLSLVEATPDEFRLKGKRPKFLTGQPCWALPALAGGKLFLRDHAKIVCVKLD